MIRALRIATLPPNYLHQRSQDRSSSGETSYAEQLASLMGDACYWADMWSMALRPLGWAMEEIVANARSLQTQWAAEAGVRFQESSWQLDILRAQVQRFQPEFLFLTDYATFPAAFVRSLREVAPSIRRIGVWCGAPYRNPAIFRECDVVLTCVPELQQHFVAEGHDCRRIDHAFDPRILSRITIGETDTAVGFIGSIILRHQFHSERERLLRQLLKKIDLTIWSDLDQPSRRSLLLMLIKRGGYDTVAVLRRLGVPESVWKRIPVLDRIAQWSERPFIPKRFPKPLLRVARPAVYGLEMFERLQRTQVSLNTHLDLSIESASNIRLFEATGVGSCLLTDWKKNLTVYFEVDREVATYRSLEECVEKARYLLDHPSKRREMAQAGQRRVLAAHTFAHRAPLLAEALRGDTR